MAASSIDMHARHPDAPQSERALRPEREPERADERALSDEQVEHLRTQFLRRVAHDIASPAGVTMTVLDELSSSDRPRPELIAMAKRSLRRLMRLSEHLSLVAELERGELEPEMARIDFRALVQQAYADATTIDGRKDVIPALVLPEGEVSIAGDGRLLLTTLREVFGNALKLACSTIEVTLSSADGYAMVRVQDDGPGFAADSASSLGTRFVKRSSARGLGLSLSMGMEILASHGGSLTVEASTLPPGRKGVAGAAVLIALPLKG